MNQYTPMSLLNVWLPLRLKLIGLASLLILVVLCGLILVAYAIERVILIFF